MMPPCFGHCFVNSYFMKEIPPPILPIENYFLVFQLMPNYIAFPHLLVCMFSRPLTQGHQILVGFRPEMSFKNPLVWPARSRKYKVSSMVCCLHFWDFSGVIRYSGFTKYLCWYTQGHNSFSVFQSGLDKRNLNLDSLLCHSHAIYQPTISL